ncbi:Ger(x)C family spore germination protein [Paenibacillus sp. JDR-2]|uniref:Ger(x)C family spore germination protein n=1 Tax=Paenibacillus sp. (strain JDR-2) TaxID=324057 RepID=UPI0001668FDF|nr:Ger(x)C family spore germination protein [Paenibacillus sp. JDR-2]ACS99649.1 germination protein, Ger(x)C family [Paenibacillus sp. JDR-2]
MIRAARRGRRMLLLAMASSVLLSGCWDRVEIDQRGFVVGVGIDEPAKKEGKQDSGNQQDSNQDSGNQSQDKQKGSSKQTFKVVYQIVMPAELSTNKADSGVSGGKAFFNMAVEENTMATSMAKLSQRLSRAPFFEHLKVIVISESIARKPQKFAETIDFFLRESQMRRSTRVMITRDKAANILNTHPPDQKLPSQYLEELSDNTKESSRILPESRIGDVHEYLLKHKSFAIQAVINGNPSYSTVTEAAVFNGTSNQLVGFLTPKETAGLNFLEGKVKGGQIKFSFDDRLGVFSIEKVTRKLECTFGPDNLPAFTFRVNVDGAVDEVFHAPDTLKEPSIKKMEEAVQKEIVKLMEMTINKLQHEYNCDVMGLREYLFHNHYKWFKQHENQWEEQGNLFASRPIQLDVKVGVRRSGNINLTED